MLNNLTILGRLTAKPELKLTPNGNYVCNFAIACQRPKKKGSDDIETDFFSCVAYGKTAETITTWYTKGEIILLNATLRNNQWTDKNGIKRLTTKLLVREVHFTFNGIRPAEEINSDQIDEIKDYEEMNFDSDIPPVYSVEITDESLDDGVPF